jgi:hypothetical protein
MLERLPVILDGGEGVAFHVHVPPASTAERPRDAGVEWLFEDAMRTGSASTLEVDVVGARMVTFEVPALPIIKEQWRSNSCVASDPSLGSSNHSPYRGSGSLRLEGATCAGVVLAENRTRKRPREVP